MGAGLAAGAAVADSAVSNIANVFTARANRRWQERMSNTSVQRRKKDFEAAGINPIVAQAFGGASTPPGSSATITPTQAHQAYLAKKLGEGQLELQDEQKKVAREDVKLKRELALTQKAQQLQYEAQKELTNAHFISEMLRMPQLQRYGDMWNSKYGKMLPYLQTGAPLLQTGINTLESLSPLNRITRLLGKLGKRGKGKDKLRYPENLPDHVLEQLLHGRK